MAHLSTALANFGHSEISTWFLEFGVDASDPLKPNMLNKPNREVRCLALVKAVYAQSKDPDSAILELAQKLGPYHWENGGLSPAMKLDGYEFSKEKGALIPASAGAADLSSAMTALEKELESRGFTTAGTHYHQAVENYGDGHHESCNGQLRSFFEALIQGLYEQKTGKVEKDPEAALQKLRSAGVIDGSEHGFAKSLWNGIQDNGPHAGLTSEQEATFRLHAASAVAVYLLHKLPKPEKP